MSLGITLVSHVPEIAEGLPKLLNQVAKDVPITTAGGTNDGDIGTSMEKIMDAFDDNEADEILAFYDLGSAKMNLEMAMEMTDKKTVHLYDAAFVEGAYTAASLIQAGVGLDEIESQLKPLKIKD
ncbi:dihydroxyacetone kinase phosphoryl donor subunit DhaM [Lactobacillus intestinalis]|uniref:phosphoenolpyruvate--glycerone phosphotransferase n=1 Tax=Lactobacillus intestinalis DSM 6629 TaxID=1423761 RepID=A0ABR5PQE1_9LACO|nr:dihydroxyacetone kinase phosphoryl donor subunit DhaM [Lactobacillus intestinalis]KRM32737.1 dihydroxyacetone kinase, phosphotransfer subunit [Lactobacillus intestinalis DSM 6629]UTW41313.1 PTS-dependent dihydroxyacetone kinase phosphotransferase subunit DhaM [Lactobacillus intestinalis]